MTLKKRAIRASAWTSSQQISGRVALFDVERTTLMGSFIGIAFIRALHFVIRRVSFQWSFLFESSRRDFVGGHCFRIELGANVSHPRAFMVILFGLLSLRSPFALKQLLEIGPGWSKSSNRYREWRWLMEVMQTSLDWSTKIAVAATQARVDNREGFHCYFNDGALIHWKKFHDAVETVVWFPHRNRSVWQLIKKTWGEENEGEKINSSLNKSASHKRWTDSRRMGEKKRRKQNKRKPWKKRW